MSDKTRRRELTGALLKTGAAVLSFVAAVEVAVRWKRQRHRRTGTRALGRPVDELARDITDDIAVIRGYCEMAKLKNESGEDLARRMDDAIAASGHLSSLIRELVASSRTRR